MPHSMTGFATTAVDAGTYQISWELRSVNHRFLDVAFRLPDEYRQHEPDFRRAVAAKIRRGKVDCSLRIAPAGPDTPPNQIDAGAVAELSSLQDALLKRFPNAAPMSIGEMLRWPGVVREPPAGELADAVAAALERAVTALLAARETEGGRLAALVEQRNAAILDIVAAVRPLAEGLPRRHAEKLKERLGRLDVQAEPDRLEQELAIVAQRLDVSEELDRIDSHVREIRSALASSEPIGRKLDFLIQELNREANTLTSKAPDEDVTRHAVELKVLIEQMREQVQNLE